MEPNNTPKQPVRPVNPAGAGVPPRPVASRPVAPRPTARPVAPRPAPSAPAAEPKEANEPTFDNGPSVVGKKERKTGWILAIILLLLIAAGGVGFGVWMWMDGNTQKEALNNQINSLQQTNIELQNKLDDVATMNDGIDGIENEVFGFRASNASGINGGETTTVCSGSFTNVCYSLSLDGKIEAEFYSVDWDAMGPSIGQYKREMDDLSEAINGTVVDIATGHVGNGAFDTVFFLISDGSVMYMQEEDILSQKYNARVLEGASNVMNIYGNKYNIDCAGFVQDFSGKIRMIVVDNIMDDGTVNLKVE